MKLLIQLLICLSLGGWLLYKSVDHSNSLTELRLSIPILEREVREIREKNIELRYAIASFESPEELLKLSAQTPYSHLHHSLTEEVIIIDKADDGS